MVGTPLMVVLHRKNEMPIYIYHCSQCDIDEETRVAVEHRDDPRFHSCGDVMKRVYSPPLPPIIRLSGGDMASATLNDGHALPNRWYKKNYENLAKMGFDKPKKEVW